ncbi:MAG: AmmeMemoRadiSam system protein B [Planctomycetaceae bacterium]
MDLSERPALRALDPRAVEVEGERRIALRDPEGYAPETALIHPGALPLLALLDGTRTLPELQEALAAPGAPRLPLQQLRRLVEALDRCLLLDNPRFRAVRAERERSFLDAPRRAAVHAGSAYPEAPEEARAFLDGILALAPAASPAPLTRLVAPHIDLRLGAEVHASAAQAMRAGGRPGLVVVLGVCHAASEQRFIACRKDFLTPAGLVPHEGGFLDRLEAGFGRPLVEGQIAHRDEHSVEFQALWLAHLWPGDPPPIAPFLIGSFHDFVARGADPAGDREVEAFLAAMRDAIAAEERRVLVVASVDLAHQGPCYGDREGLDGEAERSMEESDAELLDRMSANDAAGFFRAVARDGNARNVCGLAPVYLTLRVGSGEGRRLGYGQGRIDPATRSVVSFAAVAFA